MAGVLTTTTRIDPIRETICSVPEAAQHFSISIPHAWRLVLTGKVDSFKLGGSRRTSLEAFARFISQGR